MPSQREAQAALELKLTRMMAVHPEANGGGRVEMREDNTWVLVVELTERPKGVKLADTFLGYPVKYKVTGYR